MQVEILRVEKSSVGSSTDRSRSLVDETPPHLAWSESRGRTGSGNMDDIGYSETTTVGCRQHSQPYRKMLQVWPFVFVTFSDLEPWCLSRFIVLSIANRQEETVLEYLNWQPKYCNANIVPHCEIRPHLKTLNLHYSEILTVTPCFLLLFTQPTGKPIFLQKLHNRKCSVFKLIAPENGRNWPHYTMSQVLTFCDGGILRLWSL